MNYMDSFWLKYNLTKGMEYREKDVRIHITPCKSNGFSISLDPNIRERRSTIRIHIGFRGDEITVQDLVGNGEGTQYQDKGYGTLLFNLALQVIRVIYLDDPDTTVMGDVSNKSDSADIEGCAKRRNHFWNSFGFTLVDPSAPNTPMSSPLHALKMVDRGLVQGYIPTTLGLSAFYRYFNRCLVPERDAIPIKAINLDDISHKGITSKDKLAALLLRAGSQVNWAFGLLAIVTIGLCLAFVLEAELAHDAIFKILAASGAALFVFYALLLHKLIGLMPAYRTYLALSEQRRQEITVIQKKIMGIEDELQGAVERVYNALAPSHPLLRDQKLQETARASNTDLVEYVDTETYARLIASIQQILSTPYTLGKDPATELDDFFFGKINSCISNHNLQQFIHKLDSASLAYQMNRILRRCDHNQLIVTDDTSCPTGFDQFAKKIASDVTLIELYRSREPTKGPELYIRFYLSEGCLDFRATLSVWKMIRAEELVVCLRALHRNGLIEKTFIKVDENGRGYSERQFLPTTPKETIMEVMCFLNAGWMSEDDIDELTQLFLHQIEDKAQL